MAISARMVWVVCMCHAPIPGHRTETGGETAAMDDLDIIADALRFLASKSGGIDQLPFDPFAAIERLRRRVLPELPEGWQIRAMDDDIWLLRERKRPPRCWEVFGAGATFAAAVSDALAKIGPGGFRSTTRRMRASIMRASDGRCQPTYVVPPAHRKCRPCSACPARGMHRVRMWRNPRISILTMRKARYAMFTAGSFARAAQQRTSAPAGLRRVLRSGRGKRKTE